MDFEIPHDIQQLIRDVDDFIESHIKPIEQRDDNIRFFDHRRENSRTDWENDGRPAEDWDALLQEVRDLADEHGFFRMQLPEEMGGRGLNNLTMAVLREHMARKGLGLHNDLQNEHSIIANLPVAEMLHLWGTQEQKDALIEKYIKFEYVIAFGLTEPGHGSDASHLETTAVRDGDEWVLNGAKRFNSYMHVASHDIVFARTSGNPGDGSGITAFIVPTDTPGIEVDFLWWTFNMPTDHAEVTIKDCRVPHDCILGDLDRGLAVAGTFVHENRIRQAASSVGAAQFCIDRSIEYAKERHTWRKPLWLNQGIQFPLVDLQSECEMVRNLVYKVACAADAGHKSQVEHMIAMANYRANRLVCEAADRAMQIHGGYGYTRHVPFEHIYRHHRRYRITEGAEEVQMRKVAKDMFA